LGRADEVGFARISGLMNWSSINNHERALLSHLQSIMNRTLKKNKENQNSIKISET
jgi:hypothetical protein